MLKKKSPLKATKLHKRKRNLRILKISFTLAAILFILGITVWFSRWSIFRINSVDVFGNVGIDADDIRNVAENQLAGAYGSLYLKANKIIYPKDSIEEKIRAQFPGISDLKVSTKGHALDISLTERKPAFIWCEGLPHSGGTEDCYFMDAGGFIYAVGPTVSGDAYLTFYGLIQDTNPIGKTFLSADKIQAIATLKKTLETHNLDIESIVADDEGAFDMYLTHGGKIVFKEDQDTQVVASSIILIQQKTQLLTKENQVKLEYIDLRFGNKVYYKYIGDNAVQTQE